MKTDELVSLLATGTDAVDAGAPARRFVVAIAGGAVVATVLMALWLDVRPTLARDAAAADVLGEGRCSAPPSSPPGCSRSRASSRPGAALGRVRTPRRRADSRDVAARPSSCWPPRTPRTGPT